MSYLLEEILIFPVKSLGGISLKKATVLTKGLALDRRWMLVDESGLFLSQRSFPKMALISTSLSENGLDFTHAEFPNLPFQIGLEEQLSQKMEVSVWEHTFSANLVGPKADEWFSKVLGRPCHLVRMNESPLRLKKIKISNSETELSFADGYPILIAGQSSLEDLNQRLEHPIEMLRFRPNLVFSGGTAFTEDTWGAFQLGKAKLKGIKPCARCQMITVNPASGTIESPEPLKTLATYRKDGNKVLFGANFICIEEGEIAVGDSFIFNL